MERNHQGQNHPNKTTTASTDDKLFKNALHSCSRSHFFETEMRTQGISMLEHNLSTTGLLMT